MATVILTVSDTGPDQIEIHVSGDPAEKPTDLTKAHHAAAAMIAAISSVAKTTTFKEEAVA